LDYQVWYDQGILNSTLVLLASALTTKSYTATGLTEGTSYVFKVAARNSVGVSALSNQVRILAAQIPDVPSAPLTTVSGDNVVISWTKPYTGGSEITSYVV
jgi:hypothetical protein